MSDKESSGSGGGGIGFFVGFFALIIFLAIASNGKEGSVFGGKSTTTPSASLPLKESAYSNPSTQSQQPLTPPAPVLTPEEKEAKIATLYRELDTLKENLREARLREPVSPYSDLVTLSAGSIYETDPDREYVTLSAKQSNTTGVIVSDWYLESYVTGERAALPDGDRVIERWRSPESTNIELLPGESAYLITGESPIDTSFHENICTGYLSNEEEFYPTLTHRCPYPKDELKRFGEHIELDNDRCYDFIDRLYVCGVPDEELSSRSRIGGVCNTFVEDTFNYNDCVRLHAFDPYFSRDGYWRIYLDERTELWRPKREIIRLMDEQDRVISVAEY